MAIIALVATAAILIALLVSGRFFGSVANWSFWWVVAFQGALATVLSIAITVAVIGAYLVAYERWSSIRRLSGATRRRVRQTSLWVAILLAIGVGILLALGFNWAIGTIVGTKSEEPTPRIEIYRTALAGVAGVGGAVALVVAYRRQRDVEQGRFVERFGAAAAQLGNADVAVRLAGVYAMAGVADESQSFSRRQQCIDVLCGYMRLPYDPQQGGSHRTGLTRTLDDVEEQFSYRQNDREVRRTIARVIREHLLMDAEISWSKHDFDFTGALFEDANFSKSIFEGARTSFSDATFTGQTTAFTRVRFGGALVTFQSATFASDVTTFHRARFTATDTSFGKAAFRGMHAVFMETQFNGLRTDFGRVAFESSQTNFQNSILPGSFDSLFQMVKWRSQPNMSDVEWRVAAGWFAELPDSD